MGRAHLAAVVALALGAIAAIAAACGTGAVDVQGCRNIETARCEAAPACPNLFNLSQPVHNDGDVAACVRFYNDACLHGLETTVAPGAVALTTCVAAINAAGKIAAATKGATDAGAVACDTIANPQNYPACAFLIPIDSGAAATDAGEDAAADASDDGG